MLVGVMWIRSSVALESTYAVANLRGRKGFQVHLPKLYLSSGNRWFMGTARTYPNFGYPGILRLFHFSNLSTRIHGRRAAKFEFASYNCSGWLMFGAYLPCHPKEAWGLGYCQAELQLCEDVMTSFKWSWYPVVKQLDGSPDDGSHKFVLLRDLSDFQHCHNVIIGHLRLADRTEVRHALVVLPLLVYHERLMHNEFPKAIYSISGLGVCSTHTAVSSPFLDAEKTIHLTYTPTSCGPNSYGKGKYGFIDRRALLNRQTEALNEIVSDDNR
ncbi:hypothetical protein CLF_104335 [Clonorchis sinensis]|uniref:PEST proteolytic signal-containing nuclear protein n=1 Tax=Clonorchis sinensis TaxID=79923 RepID=G7YBF7_CLOSI|nr:hypothetical protein CLF_104335 [Clonorchis sinensis]